MKLPLSSPNRKIFFFGLLSLYCFAARSGSTTGPGNPSASITSPNQGFIINGLAAEATLSQSKRSQTFDASSLNLKNATPSLNALEKTASAISISLVDFNTITANGNSWLFFKNADTKFSMNIGTASNSVPQKWTLPANFSTYSSIVGRSDFIAPSSIPVGLQITGANKVMRTLFFDNTNRPMKVYDHYNISTSIINHLGTSYDLEVDTDKDFDEPDFEASSVPLALNDNFVSSVEEESYLTNLTLTKYTVNSTADAYGTITTPDGTFGCLRLSTVTQKYTRPDESTAYTLSETINEVSFMTREGIFFNAQTSATSGIATLNNFQYRKVVLTALLSESNDVKLNNDTKGITINVDNSVANPSAILDVKSDSLGILIPRIAKVNRPHSPATGLLVYQIDSTPGFYYFDGTAWQRMNNTVVSSARIAASEGISQSGTGLLSDGSIFIKFDSPQENHEVLNIQLQAEGDCNGLYISNRTKEGFEVKELQKGKSNVKFSWSMNQ